MVFLPSNLFSVALTYHAFKFSDKILINSVISAAWVWVACVCVVPASGELTAYRVNWCHCDLDPCLEDVLLALVNSTEMPSCSPGECIRALGWWRRTVSSKEEKKEDLEEEEEEEYRGR